MTDEEKRFNFVCKSLENSTVAKSTGLQIVKNILCHILTTGDVAKYNSTPETDDMERDRILEHILETTWGSNPKPPKFPPPQNLPGTGGVRGSLRTDVAAFEAKT